MGFLPDYIGPSAFGLKTGVILPGTNLTEVVLQVLRPCNQVGLLEDGDVLCITESVLARSQNNYVTIDEIGRQVAEMLRLSPSGTVGVLFPLASRNRFALILEGIAKAVPEGKVIMQLSFPTDEVGNPFIPAQLVESLGKDLITTADLPNKEFKHPLTGVDYIRLYERIIEQNGAKAEIFLCNDPQAITRYEQDGIIVADIHSREKTSRAIAALSSNFITLQQLCSDPRQKAWSEWGLLGSNMSSGQRLKLAPREADSFVLSLQESVYQSYGKKIEIIVYGDGAYKDPSSGIYELADPRPAFGATPGVVGRLRSGIKYKLLADELYEEGRSAQEIERLLEIKSRDESAPKGLKDEGTTPRRLEDVLASLADLVSGSADAGTPLVLIKGFIR